MSVITGTVFKLSSLLCGWNSCGKKLFYFEFIKHRMLSVLIPSLLTLLTVINFDISWTPTPTLHKAKGPAELISGQMDELCVLNHIKSKQLALKHIAIKAWGLISWPCHPRIWVCAHPDSDRGLNQVYCGGGGHSFPPRGHCVMSYKSMLMPHGD